MAESQLDNNTPLGAHCRRELGKLQDINQGVIRQGGHA